MLVGVLVSLVPFRTNFVGKVWGRCGDLGLRNSFGSTKFNYVSGCVIQAVFPRRVRNSIPRSVVCGRLDMGWGRNWSRV